MTQYCVPVLERIPWLQFMLSGEQNHPLAMQLIPLVTLWPLLAQDQHTVSPSVIFSVFGTKARPCPTVTSHTRGGNPSHGVPRERGVGVGLAGVVRVGMSKAAPVAANKMKQKTARNRRPKNVLFGFVFIKWPLTPRRISKTKAREDSSNFLRPIGQTYVDLNREPLQSTDFPAETVDELKKQAKALTAGVQKVSAQLELSKAANANFTRARRIRLGLLSCALPSSW